MNESKGKIIILYALIAFMIVVIGCLLIITFLSAKEENKDNVDKLSTTTRRTMSSTSTLPTNETTEVIEPPTTTTSTTTSTTSTSKKTTKRTTTSRKKTTKKTTTTKKITTSVPDFPEPIDRETTNESTDYPNALDEWEWKVVDAINAERIKNGLNPLEVAVDLRRLAEEAADFWYEYDDDEISDYLEGYSHYAIKSNNLSMSTGYNYLIDRTKINTKVTTNKYMRYLGVGVIYLDRGLNGIKTHYYVIIYE